MSDYFSTLKKIQSYNGMQIGDIVASKYLQGYFRITGIGERSMVPDGTDSAYFQLEKLADKNGKLVRKNTMHAERGDSCIPAVEALEQRIAAARNVVKSLSNLRSYLPLFHLGK